MTTRTTLLTLTALICGLSTPTIAAATEPKLEGTFSDWKVYSRSEGGEKICYALASPSEKKPTSVKHGDIYFMVANWKSGAASEQPSLLTGYALKNSKPPSLKVGNTQVSMYVADNEGFIQNNRDEQKLVKAMRAGATMKVSAVSQRGTSTSYDFSLKGVTAALRKAKASCS